MRLLVDTDAFCKLTSSGLFAAAADLLGGKASTVERLPALPHMLRRGKLRKTLGDQLADHLLPLAEMLPVVPEAPSEFAGLLVGKDGIDVGEVQLFALTASDTLFLMSGDKRALRAIGREQAIVTSLARKIVCLEAILLGLCMKLGREVVRTAVGSHARLDQVFTVCFSPGTTVPEDCLGSYLRELQAAVHPLVLWMPKGGAQ